LKPISTRHTLRAIATFEAIKGAAAFALVIGLLDLVHHNVRRLAIELIGRFGLNPGARYPSMLLRYADSLKGANIRVLMLVAAIYITVRLLEAYGLWNERTWGEWLGSDIQRALCSIRNSPSFAPAINTRRRSARIQPFSRWLPCGAVMDRT
jgi:uncharacterized membrane protein (DUF2068 family)